MSAILAVLDLRDGNVDEVTFQRMLRTIDDRGPDGRGTWVRGPAGLGHQALALTPEEVDESQPVVIGHLVGVFDGRLDNRDELLDALPSGPPDGRTVGDAELVVRAYAKWGNDCPARLFGDFGFAVWDPTQRRLFCARDRVGVRPLYYWQRGPSLVVATDIRGVLSHPALSKEPNEAHVADLFADQFRDRRDTLYAGVFRIPPAHTLTVASGRVRLERYWDVDVHRRTSPRPGPDDADRLVALLSDAISCRLRARDAPTVSLSGGLDSSLITALAVDSVRSSPSSPPGVTATSLIYPGLSCDESDYIRDVVGMIGLPSRRIVWTPLDWEEMCAHAARTAYLAPQPNAPLEMFCRAGVRRTVVVTGIGGDQWMKGSTAHFVDLVRARRYRELSTLVQQGAGPIFAQVVLQAVKARTITRARRPRAGQRLPWVGYALRHQIERQVEPDVSIPSDVAKSTQERYLMLHNPRGAHNFEAIDRAAAQGHLGIACPFWRGSDRRWLERRALRGRVPDRVTYRPRAAEFSPTYEAQFRTLPLSSLVTASRLAELGWIRTDELLSAASASRMPERISVRQLRFVLAVEAWVRMAWN
jgi:asparagine synthase (glutamine-hydrolysing)